MSPFWSLVQLEMVKHSTLLHSRMPSSISSHLLIRVGLSSMFLRENGSLEASISQAISPSFWKKVLSLLELRYCFFFFISFWLLCLFFADPLHVEMVHVLTLRAFFIRLLVFSYCYYLFRIHRIGMLLNPCLLMAEGLKFPGEDIRVW